MSIEKKIQTLSVSIDRLTDHLGFLMTEIQKNKATPIAEVKQKKSTKNKTQDENTDKNSLPKEMSKDTRNEISPLDISNDQIILTQAADTLKELEQSSNTSVESPTDPQKAPQIDEKKVPWFDDGAVEVVEVVEVVEAKKEEEYRVKVKALAFKKMQEGVERVEIKKLIINLGCEQIADISGKNLELFEKQLLELKAK